MAAIDTEDNENEPEWRQRAVSRSLTAARSRAEQRIQRFLDAAFELIDEKGTTEFTIQEVIDRSKQSLRGFYQYFDGKDELLFALLEETIREALADLLEVTDGAADPLGRLRDFDTMAIHRAGDGRPFRRRHAGARAQGAKAGEDQRQAGIHGVPHSMTCPCGPCSCSCASAPAEPRAGR